MPIGERTLIMGILNVTPDSFSDGGKFLDPEAARAHAEALMSDGADIIDIGGESTRPGAEPLSAEEEWRRVGPALTALGKATAVPISIDTYKADMARKALESGAKIVNDVWGFQKDTEMAHVVADFEAGVVLMHNRERADADLDIIVDVVAFLSRSIDTALKAGVKTDRIVLDPGVGFGKTVDQSAEVIARLSPVTALGFPVLLGASRKRFIGNLLGIDNPAERLHGTLGAHLAAATNGADIIRAHDIKPHREAFDVFDAVRSVP